MFQKLINKFPLIAYVSASKIGHQAWETMMHCAYANKMGRKIVIIFSNNVINKSFNILEGKNITFLNTGKILSLMNGKSLKCNAEKFLKGLVKIFNYILRPSYVGKQDKKLLSEKPFQTFRDNNYRFNRDVLSVFFDLVLEMFPSLRSRPFFRYDKEYWNLSLLIRHFKPIQIKDKYTETGKKLLNNLGIPPEGWFVCLHLRESSTHQDFYREWQNQNVDNYCKAIKYIIDQGGYVIKMGDSSMREVPEIKNFIDYPHTKYKSNFADLYLSSKAKFCIVSNSGYRALPMLFHVPLVTVNMYPLTPLDIYDRTLITYKKVFAMNLGRELQLREIMNEPTLCHRHTDAEYQEAGFRIIENTENEILEAVIEMFNLLNNGFISFTDCQLLFQRRTKEVLENSTHTFGYGDTMFYPDGICRIGSNYMEKTWE